MGLDMYLRASEYVSRKDYFTDENGNTQSKDNDLFSAIVENFGVAEQIDQDFFHWWFQCIYQEDLALKPPNGL